MASFFSGNEFAKIIVGRDDSQTFYVHKNLLCAKAGFFDSTLNGSYAKAQLQEVELSEEDPRAFELFINWVYSDIVRPCPDGPHQIQTMLALYIFAMKAGLHQLANAVMDELRQLLNKQGKLAVWGEDRLDGLSVHDGLGKFAVESHAWVHYCFPEGNAIRELSTRNLSRSPALSVEVLRRVTALMHNKAAKENPVTTASDCRYHVHKGEMCAVQLSSFRTISATAKATAVKSENASAP
ncbi:MAG: hypothetical protein M1814_002602 [Vezdaea aestivalis]|nr:MAG: hypothetical protein M1814_002602 [Vezdaea aestivalis]